jgi:predicted lipid-binding transport protein (Tim44 family)
MDAMPDSKAQGAAQATPPSSSAAAPAAAAPRRGLGGMLGGLMMGGLLGALFFGGAFENINFMDILVFAALALVAFMAFRHFAARRAAPQYAASGAYGAPATGNMDAAAKSENVYQRNTAAMPLSSRFTRPKLVFPAGFNEKEFLDGAKRAHELLQKAWDNGELADLREFTTDKVFGEVQDQYRARSGENRTEISDVRAELLDVKEIDGKLEASVLFDCSMAEYDANSPVLVNSERVREVWHFVRAKTSLRPTWLLDGIQQVVE